MLNIEQAEIEGGSCRGLKYQIIEVIFFTLLNEMKYKIMHNMIKDYIIFESSCLMFWLRKRY